MDILTILSLSSSTIRSAVFLPIPFAFVIAFVSPAAIATASLSGVSSERTAIAALGPTPETVISNLKESSSVCVEKPNKSIASSLTERYVNKLTSSPILPTDFDVFSEVKHLKPTPPHSTTEN